MKKLLNRLFDIVFDLLYSRLFPASNKRMFVISIIFTSVLSCVYYFAYQNKREHLLPYYVKGEITKVAVQSSSGVGRTSGRNTIYYFKVKGYNATFEMSDLVNFEFFSLKRGLFHKGNYVEFGIDERDKWRLPIEDDSYGARITPIGLKVNGIQEVKIYQSIFDYFYNKYLYISIPIFFYYLMLTMATVVIILRLFNKKEVSK